MTELTASSFAPLRCEFTLSSDFLHDAVCQHGNIRVARKLLTALKAVCVACLLGLSGCMFFGVKHTGGGVFLLGLCLLLLFSRSLDRLIVTRRIRQSPSWNRAIVLELDAEGLRSSSELGSSFVRWAGFTRAVGVRDGFLLYQGPRAFNWLPLRAFSASPDPAAIAALLASKVKIYEDKT